MIRVCLIRLIFVVALSFCSYFVWIGHHNHVGDNFIGPQPHHYYKDQVRAEEAEQSIALLTLIFLLIPWHTGVQGLHIWKARNGDKSKGSLT